MPFHSETPHFIHRMKEANRLMTFAMRRDPEAYFEQIQRPPLEMLAEVAGEYTAAEYSHVYGEESRAVDLLKAGIKDSIPPFEVIADAHPELTIEQALQVMTNPATTKTYGMLASMSQAEMQKVLAEASDYFTLDASTNALIAMKPITPDPGYGCEAVDMRHGKEEMSPVFKKFAPWAGSLAVYSYFN